MSIGIACIAFIIGYFIAHQTRHTYTTIEPSKAIVRTNGISNLPYINPLTECIREKGIRMEELKSFKDKIDEYVTNYCLKHKGVKVSYYFRDLNNGMFIGLNEKELFSPASLMKVPTMIAVLKEAQSKPEILNQQVQYNQKDYMQVDEDAGYQKEDGRYYSIDELLQQSIAYSDNAATLMLMNFIGMAKVVKVEDDMNLHVASDYTNQTNFVSVKNYAGVFRILYNGAYLNEIMSEKALEILLSSKYNGGLRSGIPNDIRIAHKYGERDIMYESGKRITQQLHHFGIVYHPLKPYILGVMTRGDNSKEEKDKIIADLSKITYEEIDNQMKTLHQERNVKFYQNM